MAYSTLKDFFNVPNLNEPVNDECTRACVQLKSYASTIDDRAWALDESVRSRFLTDLVACKLPGGESGIRGRSAGRGERGERGRRVTSDNMRVNTADSLIEATNFTLDKVQNLLQEKRSLQQKLNNSEENLRTARAEYEKIKDILNRKYDRNEFNEYFCKLQKLAASGRFTKEDERDFASFFGRIEELGKAYEISQAENAYLKHLLEKLSRRAQMDKIPVEPETCTDIPYLQDQVNRLRKELMALRGMEDNKMAEECHQGMDVNIDAGNLSAILKERNALRCRLRAMQDIEKQVSELRKRLCEANQFTNDLSSNLNSNSKYINNLENEMRDMQAHYEKIEDERCCSIECLKRKVEDLKRELCQARTEGQKVAKLQTCLNRMEESIRQRDRKLCEYDAQFKQLMRVICELRNGGNPTFGGVGGTCTLGATPSCCCGNIPRSSQQQQQQDCQTQTACNEAIDELVYYTSATLTQIQNELNKRGIKCGGADADGTTGGATGAADGDDFGKGGRGGGASTHSLEDCCKEVERLRQIVNTLQGDKSRLRLSILERSRNLDDLANRVDEMSDEVDKNAQDTAGVRSSLNGAMNLVNNISHLQDQNNSLLKAFGNLSKKEQEDFLNDLQKRLNQCLDEKGDLRLILRQHGLDPDQLLKQLQEKRARGEAPPRGASDLGMVIPGFGVVKKELSTVPVQKMELKQEFGAPPPPPSAPSAPALAPLPSWANPNAKPGEPGYYNPNAKPGEPGYYNPNAKPGEPGYIPKLGEPGYYNPNAKPGEPGYYNPNAKPGEPGYMPKPGEPGYINPSAKPGEPGYYNPNAKPGEPGYMPKPGEPGYVNPNAKPGEPGYYNPNAKPGEPGYMPKPGEPGYVNPNAKPGEPGYYNPNAKPGEPGYMPKPGEPGYVNPNAKPGEPGYYNPNAKPGEPGYMPKPGEPGYVNPNAKPGEPGYVNPNAKPGEPGYIPKPGEPGYVNPNAKPGEPGYFNPNAKPGEPGYIPKPGEPGYVNPNAKPGEPGYVNPNARPGEPGYVPKPGEPGYVNPNAKPGEPGYFNPNAKPGEPGYVPKPGEPGYVNPNAKPGEPGYVNPNAKPGEPGYVPKPGEPGYVNPAARPGEPGYVNTAARPGEPGYIPKPGEPGYVDPNAKPGDPGYVNPNAKPGEPGYVPKPGEPGYVNPNAKPGDPGYYNPNARPGEPGYIPKPGEPGYVNPAARPGDPGYYNPNAKPGEPGYMDPKLAASVSGLNTAIGGAGPKPGDPGYVDPNAKPGQPGYFNPNARPGEPGYVDNSLLPGLAGTKPGDPGYFDPNAKPGQPGYYNPNAKPGEPGYIFPPGQSGKKRAGSLSSRAGPSGRTDSQATPGAGGAYGPGGRGDRKPGVGGPGTYRGGQKKTSDTGYDQYGNFVEQSAHNLALNLQGGSSLEKELKKILDAFVEECRSCLCQLKVPKSKFYAICHKILHQGIMCLSFKEMAYIHKKIYYAAEKLFPGCLLNVILTEYSEVVDELKKCCSCKSQLCCDSSQEMLKDKVKRLEVEVEMARNYLDNMRSKRSNFESDDFLSFHDGPNDSFRVRKGRDSCRSRSTRHCVMDDDDDDDRDSTFRQRTHRSSPKYSTKQIKNIKACLTRCSQNLK